MCLVYSIALNNKEPKDGKNIKEKEMGLMLNNNKGEKVARIILSQFSLQQLLSDTRKP